MREEQLASATEIFQQAADGIYSWIVGKYGVLFKGMPQKTSTYHADILAYHVAVNYDPANRRLNMHVRHMDMEAAASGIQRQDLRFPGRKKSS